MRPEASLPPPQFLAVERGFHSQRKHPVSASTSAVGRGPWGLEQRPASGLGSKTTGKDSRLFVKTKNASLRLVLPPVRASVCPSARAAASWAPSAASSGRCCCGDLFRGLVSRRLSSFFCENVSVDVWTWRSVEQRAARGRYVGAERGPAVPPRLPETPCASRSRKRLRPGDRDPGDLREGPAWAEGRAGVTNSRGALAGTGRGAGDCQRR